MKVGASKQVSKEIDYVKGKPKVFDISSYTIKSGKSRIITGDYIIFVENEMFTCAFTISTFINGVLNI